MAKEVAGQIKLQIKGGAANPHAGDAGIPQDRQHTPLPPRL